jgi:hypothetical protein
VVPLDRPTTIRAGVRLIVLSQVVTLSTFTIYVALLSVEVESGPRLTRVALMGQLRNTVRGTSMTLGVALPGMKEPGLTRLPLRLSHV